VEHFDKNVPFVLQEFGKSLAMINNNAGDPLNQAKTDWSVNKRAYKHRIVTKNITGHLRSEYWVTY
jgi:hypothetical protein